MTMVFCENDDYVYPVYIVYKSYIIFIIVMILIGYYTYFIFFVIRKQMSHIYRWYRFRYLFQTRTSCQTPAGMYVAGAVVQR